MSCPRIYELREMSVEEWVENSPDEAVLINAMVEHAKNAWVDTHDAHFEEEEFRRHCAITIRQYLKEDGGR